MEEMIRWAHQNGLALYGAVVGTVALLINIGKYLHTVRKDAVKLTVAVEKHDQYDEGIERLKRGPDTLGGGEWQPAYIVKVTNLGSVTAHLQNVSVICKEGSIEALCTGQSGFLVNISKSLKKSIHAKDSQEYVVWHTRDSMHWKPEAVSVQDQTGKCWKRSAKGLRSLKKDA